MHAHVLLAAARDFLREKFVKRQQHIKQKSRFLQTHAGGLRRRGELAQPTWL